MRSNWGNKRGLDTYSENLLDRYSENCRISSEVTAIRTARTIEQGLGRSVRGEKDYCVIILIGASLIKSLRSKESRGYLSNQTRKQIEIGLEIAEMAREEVGDGTEASVVLGNLINQCLRRDDGWKAFYAEQMDAVFPALATSGALQLFETELTAERKYQAGDVDGAVAILQSVVDNIATDDFDRGWYLQEIARFLYTREKIESNKLQIAAHKTNRYLMKPRSGMTVKKINVVSQKRMENIRAWVNKFENYEELSVILEDMLSSLQFGVESDRFETAFDNLARALGFMGERPDKEWKEGPDNLWALRDNTYLVVECKNEVDLIRNEIYKSETDQMNKSCAWFTRHYAGAQATKVMIIPTRKLANAAAFTDPTIHILDKRGLEMLVRNVRNFFHEFKSQDLKNLSEKYIHALIDTHKLSVDDILSEYTQPFRPYRNPSN